MPISAKARLRGLEVFQQFQTAGAQAVDTDILQPAETLLDLYGETIRARAYVTQDSVQGEMMMRPDFTVPVVQMHMRDGAEPARYTYMGDVFRKQAEQSARASEYLQVGYEVFDRSDPAGSDAEVFLRINDVVRGLNLRSVMGDIGIITAAVHALTTSPSRRDALLRHIWRPVRFDALINRFSGPVKSRHVTVSDAPLIGLRSEIEIADRLRILENDAAQDPLDPTELAALSEILTLSCSAPKALEKLINVSNKWPKIKQAVERLSSRLSAMEASGVDVTAIEFDGSYGRTSLEYYDGFVFGFYSEQVGWPPIASGGRYDALTNVLGQGRSIPAVGGVVRPELLIALEDAR